MHQKEGNGFRNETAAQSQYLHAEGAQSVPDRSAWAEYDLQHHRHRPCVLFPKRTVHPGDGDRRYFRNRPRLGCDQRPDDGHDRRPDKYEVGQMQALSYFCACGGMRDYDPLLLQRNLWLAQSMV